MRRVGLTFGVVSGVLLAAFVLIGLALWQTGVTTVDSAAIWGYTTMLVSLSVVFFGVKSYRDKHLNGSIQFWPALRLGLLISLVAAVMYAAAWEGYCATQPENYWRFLNECQQAEIVNTRNSGATQEEVDATAEQMASFMGWFRNPVLRFGLTMAEALPVGILVSVVAALVLRRKQVAPAN